MPFQPKKLPALALWVCLKSSSRRKEALTFALGLLVLLPLTGCVTKSQADAQARIAFLQGQNEVLMRGQNQNQRPAQSLPQANGLNVRIVGPVNNPVVPWRIGLTLAQAIVSAGYSGNTDPSAITIRRSGQDIPVDPKGLLNGEDFVLEIGDVIELQP